MKHLLSDWPWDCKANKFSFGFTENISELIIPERDVGKV